jgi:hypothetical protein
VTIGSVVFLREGYGVEAFKGNDLGVVIFSGIASGAFTPSFFDLNFGEPGRAGAGGSAGAVSA